MCNKHIVRKEKKEEEEPGGGRIGVRSLEAFQGRSFVRVKKKPLARMMLFLLSRGRGGGCLFLDGCWVGGRVVAT